MGPFPSPGLYLHRTGPGVSFNPKPRSTRFGSGRQRIDPQGTVYGGNLGRGGALCRSKLTSVGDTSHRVNVSLPLLKCFDFLPKSREEKVTYYTSGCGSFGPGTRSLKRLYSSVDPDDGWVGRVRGLPPEWKVHELLRGVRQGHPTLLVSERPELDPLLEEQGLPVPGPLPQELRERPPLKGPEVRTHGCEDPLCPCDEREGSVTRGWAEG